jgi:DNA-binding NarL/FixJ family response regulator
VKGSQGARALRVLVVDDHPVVREGLRAMLDAEPDLDVVGEAGSGEEAVRLAAELGPDVVLMDLRMPGVDGVAATGRITASGTAKVLVVTTYDTDADILRAVEAGATGYLLKDTPRRDLADAVRAAARGETVLAPPVAAKLVTRVRTGGADPLTRREVEVLGQVARGLSNPEIGRVLLISEATVKTHLLRAFEKLGVGDRTAAVTRAISRGILRAD